MAAWTVVAHTHASATCVCCYPRLLAAWTFVARNGMPERSAHRALRAVHLAATAQPGMVSSRHEELRLTCFSQPFGESSQTTVSWGACCRAWPGASPFFGPIRAGSLDQCRWFCRTGALRPISSLTEFSNCCHVTIRMAPVHLSRLHQLPGQLDVFITRKAVTSANLPGLLHAQACHVYSVAALFTACLLNSTTAWPTVWCQAHSKTKSCTY